MMVHDLQIVERQLGFQYELPGGAHYQQVCPRCRRALFGLSQGALWSNEESRPPRAETRRNGAGGL
jgi:hypothetical protein